MQDFNYHNPVKIIFGAGKTAQIGASAAQFGQRALLVFGHESVKKSGLHSRIAESLAASGVSSVDHGGVKPNPLVEHAREGIVKIAEHGLQVVIAAGGGSVMDEAKTIAAAAASGCDPWDFFVTPKRPHAALPVVALPTIAATGSEMNGNSVMSSRAAGLKLGFYSPLVYPKISILDPELTFSVPPDQTAYGLVDTFSHIMEPYFGGKDPQTPVQDRLAEGLFAALFDIAPRVMQNPRDYRARADMQWASAVALCGLAQAGRGPAGWENHAIAHALGAMYDAPHGACLAVVMPGWMDFASRRQPEKFVQFAQRIMGTRGAPEGIAALKQWFGKLGAPTSLGQLGIGEADIPGIAHNVLECNPGIALGTDGVVEVLKLCLK